MSVSKTSKIYEVIEKKAGSNETMQAISALFGFPFTLVTDAAVIFTHYGPMVNEIRGIYGRKPVSKETLFPVIKGASSEILSDLIFDKLIGQIPVVGIASNIMCAKAMTWRVGLLFAILSARGEDITNESVAKTCRLIRTLFPQRNTFAFRKPSIVIVEKLLNTVEGEDIPGFEEKVERILENL